MNDLRWRGGIETLGRKPLVIGIVNVTPDSFSDGGSYLATEAAIAHGERLVAEGADLLDIGGESTRPGAEPVHLSEELRRVMPVVAGLAARVSVPLSIDTYKPEVARQAVAAGAAMINDVTGFRDAEMRAVAAGCDAALVVMHIRGDPRTMQQLADYEDVVADVQSLFAERLATLAAEGIDPRRVVLDPGIGFAKKRSHNLELFRRLAELGVHGRPILLGASRKSILGELTDRPPAARLPGTLATSYAAVLRGASFLRVHDVAATVDLLAVAMAIET